MTQAGNQAEATETEIPPAIDPPRLDYSPRPLTKRERRVLNRLWRQHKEQLPWTRLFTQILLSTVIFGAIAAVAELWLGWQSTLLAFIGGALYGVIVNGVGVYRKARQNWPIVASVVDWQQVEQLIARNVKSSQ
jgi:hypothetical protein